MCKKSTIKTDKKRSHDRKNFNKKGHEKGKKKHNVFFFLPVQFFFGRQMAETLFKFSLLVFITLPHSNGLFQSHQ